MGRIQDKEKLAEIAGVIIGDVVLLQGIPWKIKTIMINIY